MPYIGLDVGTSGCKAAVMDEEGNILKTAYANYDFVYPASGYVELDPKKVWNQVKKVLQEIAVAARQAKMLTVSSIGEAMVILDGEDRPLYNGIVYLDQRCKDMTPEILDKMCGDELHAIAGVPVNQMYSLYKYLWLSKYRPNVLECAQRICLFGDYITYMLSGEQLIDASTASRTLLFDALQLRWSDKIMNTFGVAGDKFSRLAKAGSVAGVIRGVLAKELNLPKALKVVVGCHDQCSATLGSGVIEAGDVMMGEGSSESINLVIQKEDINEKLIKKGVCYEPYVQAEQYLIPVGQLSHGNSIKWFVEKFYSDLLDYDERNLYEQVNKMCADSSGNVFFLPYLSGGSTTDNSQFVLGGFWGLDITIGRDRMYRALLEGLSFESKYLFELLKSFGFQIEKIVASGGCSKSELLMQLKADIIQHDIHILQNSESGIRGLGIICAVADQSYNSYQEAARQFVNTGKFYTPKMNYMVKYKEYRKISNAVKDIYRKNDFYRSMV